MKEIVPRGIHTCLSSAPSKIDLIPYAFVHVGRWQLSLILRNKISRECSKVRGHIGDTIRCFLLFLERHPVRSRSCSLLELRLVIPLSRR